MKNKKYVLRLKTDEYEVEEILLKVEARSKQEVLDKFKEKQKQNIENNKKRKEYCDSWIKENTIEPRPHPGRFNENMDAGKEWEGRAEDRARRWAKYYSNCPYEHRNEFEYWKEPNLDCVLEYPDEFWNKYLDKL